MIVAFDIGSYLIGRKFGVNPLSPISPGKTIEGAYIDSCFVPEMLSRFKTARRKVLNAMELAQKKGINITALGGFTSIIFENFNLLQHQQVRNTTLDWKKFTTGNTHTAWVICRQLEENAPLVGLDLKESTVAVVGATGAVGREMLQTLSERNFPIKNIYTRNNNQINLF